MKEEPRNASVIPHAAWLPHLAGLCSGMTQAQRDTPGLCSEMYAHPVAFKIRQLYILQKLSQRFTFRLNVKRVSAPYEELRQNCSSVWILDALPCVDAVVQQRSLVIFYNLNFRVEIFFLFNSSFSSFFAVQSDCEFLLLLP